MPYYQGDLGVETKGDGSPVTLADRAAENLLRDLIRTRFPEDGILGEEYGEQPGASGRRWILDPIDGTKAFVHGVPMFGVLIGMEQDGAALLGVVFLPALYEMVYAGHGLGCWWQPGGSRAEAAPRRARSLLSPPWRSRCCASPVSSISTRRTAWPPTIGCCRPHGISAAGAIAMGTSWSPPAGPISASIR